MSPNNELERRYIKSNILAAQCKHWEWYLFKI